MKPLVATIALLLLLPPLAAQLDMPSASPRGTLLQEVGLAQVVVEYGRPGVKGRTIFGGLLPYGQLWRTGANASTKLSLDRDADFGGMRLPAGDYALYTIPKQESWTVIVSENTELWGTAGYDPADDALRLEVPVTRTEEPTETFTIDFRGFHMDGAELVLRWEHVEIAVPVRIDSATVIGPVPANTYFDAAKYYVEAGKSRSQAAEWVELAVEQQPEAFWMVYFRADLARQAGDLDTARQWATRARDLAAEAQSDFGYVERSEALLTDLDGEG